MSLGPKQQEEDIRVKSPVRTQVAIKKVVLGFFDKPIHYMFYITFFATIIGLFFGMEFNWKFYIMLLILTCIKIINQLDIYDGRTNKQRIK